MNRMLRIYYTFGRSFGISNICITVVCAWLLWELGVGSFVALLYFKVFTSAAIFYLANTIKQKEYYYYANLGFGKAKLWIPLLAADLLSFILAIIISYNIRILWPPTG